MLLQNIYKYRSILPLNIVRNMSCYPPQYIEPIFKPKIQDELKKTGELSKLSHVPIRAARNNDNCSVFHDDTLSKFTNYVMRGGCKNLANELIKKSLENIKRSQLERYHLAEAIEEKEKIETSPLKILHLAIENCKPLMQLTPIKRGGVKYQVPIPVTEKRSRFMAMKWLIEAANEKERKIHFPEKLAWELLDAASGQGRVVKRKQDLHKQCEANRAYAHYRWG